MYGGRALRVRGSVVLNRKKCVNGHGRVKIMQRLRTSFVFAFLLDIPGHDRSRRYVFGNMFHVDLGKRLKISRFVILYNFDG